MADLLEPDRGVVDRPFAGELGDRYLVYALSTITARSLPDVRDGLKPVHRRLLWAMRLLRLDPANAPKKCARVVGDVIGKYHPHGDQSVYDALVRLAQTFALRYPLVDGQGNFGNIDGDNPAAMRYTEARLTAASVELMAGLDEGAVPFKPTYNGEEEEPEVFPGLFPNLLANGAAGIAVGMATSIPPHNVAEIIDAALLVLADDGVDDAGLLDAVLAVMPGPDFPTGGVVVEPAGAMREAYATGRGGFRLRARYADVEPLGQGLWQLVVTEIPYQLPKGKLIEQLAALVTERRLPILEDVRDESDDAIRIVIVPRSRNVDPQVLKESLFKLTDLEVRVPLNMNVLDADRRPSVMPLLGVLRAWLDHHRAMLVARARHRLAKIADRRELVAGFLIAYLDLDAVIRIIREEDEPKPALIARFALTDRQAEAILNLRLRSLRRLEELELKREADALATEADALGALVADPARQKQRLRADLKALRKRFGPETPLGRRRTGFAVAGATRAVDLHAMIEREPLTVIASAKGWIRALKGHAEEGAPETLRFKDGDGPAFCIRAQTTDRLIVATSTGRMFTLVADKLPGGRGFGEPIRLLADLEPDAAIVALFVCAPQARVLLVADDARGFLATAADLLAETRKGRQVMLPRAGAKLAFVRMVPAAADHVAAIGANRRLLIIKLADVPALTRGQGAPLMRFKDGALADVRALKLGDGLSWPMSGDTGRTRTEGDLTPWVAPRGTAGRVAPNGFPRTNRFD